MRCWILRTLRTLTEPLAGQSAGSARSLFALKISARPATHQKTYGYLRVEILAALANAGQALLSKDLTARAPARQLIGVLYVGNALVLLPPTPLDSPEPTRIATARRRATRR